MANRSTVSSIDKYIAEFPPETQKVLEELRALVRATAPDVTEKISFYPVTVGVTEALKEELKPYRHGKGSVQFPLGQPMPTDLIRRIVEFRAEDVTGNDT
jgi:uncharacterized protein YdhG (YjbR/CyaY superfamily)